MNNIRVVEKLTELKAQIIQENSNIYVENYKLNYYEKPKTTKFKKVEGKP